ncbi:MAG: DUF998 domain-containing protein [Propionibacteriales bacterium]|nr:DUF998 domain-containing protein [Propionibacteriales bacterium]
MRRQRWAAALWTGEIIFFVGNVVAQAAWTVPYDPLGYAISDLGAVTCFTNVEIGRLICSPAHLIMNLGLIITGVLMATGAVVFPLARRTRLDRLSRVLLVIGGLGCALVGLAPEDVAVGPHTVGAVSAMVIGNIGLALFGIALRQHRPAGGSVAITFAIIGLAGVIWLIALLLSGSPLRYSVGGLAERVAACSLVIGQVVVGLTVLMGKSRPSSRIES